jgi:hypothetical protein
MAGLQGRVSRVVKPRSAKQRDNVERMKQRGGTFYGAPPGVHGADVVLVDQRVARRARRACRRRAPPHRAVAVRTVDGFRNVGGVMGDNSAIEWTEATWVIGLALRPVYLGVCGGWEATASKRSCSLIARPWFRRCGPSVRSASLVAVNVCVPGGDCAARVSSVTKSSSIAKNRARSATRAESSMSWVTSGFSTSHVWRSIAVQWTGRSLLTSRSLYSMADRLSVRHTVNSPTSLRRRTLKRSAAMSSSCFRRAFAAASAPLWTRRSIQRAAGTPSATPITVASVFDATSQRKSGQVIEGILADRAHTHAALITVGGRPSGGQR